MKNRNLTTVTLFRCKSPFIHLLVELFHFDQEMTVKEKTEDTDFECDPYRFHQRNEISRLRCRTYNPGHRLLGHLPFCALKTTLFKYALDVLENDE